MVEATFAICFQKKLICSLIQEEKRRCAVSPQGLGAIGFQKQCFVFLIQEEKRRFRRQPPELSEPAEATQKPTFAGRGTRAGNRDDGSMHKANYLKL